MTMEFTLKILTLFAAIALMGIGQYILNSGKRDDYPQEKGHEGGIRFWGLEERYRKEHVKVARWFLYPGLACFIVLYVWLLLSDLMIS